MQLITRIQVAAAFDSIQAPYGVDVETNALPVWNPLSKLVAMSFAGISRTTGAVTGFQIPIAHREGQNCDLDVMALVAEKLDGARCVPFFVPFETQILLHKMGIRPTWVGDAYYAARMAQLKDFGLKDLTEHHLQRRTIRFEEVCKDPSGDYSTVHAQDPLGIEYTVADSVNGLQLEMFVRAKYITPHGMNAVYEIEVQAASLMSEYSAAGYTVDLAWLEREIKQEEVAVKELEESIFETLGTKFVINSGVQLGKALKEKWGIRSPKKTPTKADSWSQDAIEVLKGRLRLGGHSQAYDCLCKIIEWKSRFSTLNSLRKRPADVSPDGRIHPSWKTIGADGTSRIYGENPSPTSLPKAARRAFRAPEGKRWMGFDWRQAEVRILAALSGDTNLKQALASGDYHRAVYAGMSTVPFDQVTSEQREASKIITYSILYSGGDPYHVAEELGITEGEALNQVRKYFSLFPQLHSYLGGLRSMALSTRHVKTYMNRLRRLEGTDLRKIQNQACNSAGQQSCGTLLKIALIKMHQLAVAQHPLMKGFEQMIPVFDACYYVIDSDVPLDQHIKLMRDSVELMVGDVKLEADFHEGVSWGEVNLVPREYIEQLAHQEQVSEP